ncbi:hypothetical protein Leryth_025598 [Lithospermum erythrorhizon]|nr:hypothetical protein Leryth_025598 [Lithospermum erythrorhizon]
MEVINKKTVKYNGQEVSMLNELEYINDEVWSNVYGSDCIARISPQNGNVHGWILLDKLRKGLLATGQSSVDILTFDGEVMANVIRNKAAPDDKDTFSW